MIPVKIGTALLEQREDCLGDRGTRLVAGGRSHAIRPLNRGSVASKMNVGLRTEELKQPVESILEREKRATSLLVAGGRSREGRVPDCLGDRGTWSTSLLVAGGRSHTIQPLKQGKCCLEDEGWMEYCMGED